MNIGDFAHTYSLKPSRDECGEVIIRGVYGHIYFHSSSRMGVLLMTTPRRWGTRRRLFTNAGFQVIQNGDCEGTALFDPADASRVRLAIKAAGVRRKRAMTPEQRAAKAEILAHARSLLNRP